MPFPSSIHVPRTWSSEGVHPGLFRPPVSPPAFSHDAGTKRSRWARRDVPPFHDAAAHPEDAYMDGDGLFGPRDPVSTTTMTTTAMAMATATATATATTRAHPRPYALAGQLSTPAFPEDNTNLSGTLGESMFSDSDYRTALGTKRSRDQMEAGAGAGAGASASTPTHLFHLPSKPSAAPGWGSLAISTIGGVVGRFWEFCRIGSFKGFSAGGGVGYHMTPAGGIAEIRHALPTPPAEETFCFHAGTNHWQRERETGRFYQDRPHTPVSSGCSTPGPARKRRQTDYVPELRRNWVMIRDPGEAGERRSPIKFAASLSTSSTSTSQRTQLSPIRSQVSPGFAANRFATPNARPPAPPALQTSTTTTPRRPAMHTPNNRFPSTTTTTTTTTTASSRLPRPASAASLSSSSFAGPPLPTPSKIPVRAAPSTAAAPPASTATTAFVVPAAVNADPAPNSHRHRRRRHTAIPPPPCHSQNSPHSRRRTNSASLASSRVGSGSGSGGTDESGSRLDAEARHLASQRRIEEREADVRMSAFNKRLQDMIRQGQQALGTTVEVDMLEEDMEDPWWDDTL